MRKLIVGDVGLMHSNGTRSLKGDVIEVADHLVPQYMALDGWAYFDEPEPKVVPEPEPGAPFDEPVSAPASPPAEEQGDGITKPRGRRSAKK